MIVFEGVYHSNKKGERNRGKNGEVRKGNWRGQFLCSQNYIIRNNNNNKKIKMSPYLAVALNLFNLKYSLLEILKEFMAIGSCL